MLGAEVPSRSSRCCGGKALFFLCMTLLAGAAFMTFPRNSVEEDPAMDMAAMPPTAMKQSVQSARTWQSRAWQPTWAARQPMQAVSALKKPVETAQASEPSSAFLAKKGRREIFQDISKLAAAFTLAGAASKEEPALAGVELPPVSTNVPERDGRLGLLGLAPLTALGWVAFQIGGPATNQLDGMSAKAAVAGGQAPKRRAAPKKTKKSR